MPLQPGAGEMPISEKASQSPSEIPNTEKPLPWWKKLIHRKPKTPPLSPELKIVKASLDHYAQSQHYSPEQIHKIADAFARYARQAPQQEMPQHGFFTVEEMERILDHADRYFKLLDRKPEIKKLATAHSLSPEQFMRAVRAINPGARFVFIREKGEENYLEADNTLRDTSKELAARIIQNSRLDENSFHDLFSQQQINFLKQQKTSGIDPKDLAIYIQMLLEEMFTQTQSLPNPQ